MIATFNETPTGRVFWLEVTESHENFDRLMIATQSNVSRNNTYANEFGHLLGVDGHLADGVAGLMQKMAAFTTFLSFEDYDLALGDTVRNHKQGKSIHSWLPRPW